MIGAFAVVLGLVLAACVGWFIAGWVGLGWFMFGWFTLAFLGDGAIELYEVCRDGRDDGKDAPPPAVVNHRGLPSREPS